MVYELVTDSFAKAVLLSSGHKNLQSVNFSFVRIVMDCKFHILKDQCFCEKRT